ncbi:deoxyhypusine synthase [Candidatus Woesearchaeota archaeon]|nr:deoxyhypusine synthase [Candidatus Woesearchaeota archaeon]
MENISFKRKKEQKTIDVNNLEKIQGFKLDKNVSALELLKNYKTLGFQASHVAKAAELIQKMKKEKVDIYLTATSNMMSSGLREIIAQLVKHKLVKAIITTTGFIEEDVMKTKKDFYLGSFEVDDTEVKENTLNRIGNIFVPDDHYVWLESFHNKFLEKTCAKKKVWSPSEYIHELGLELNDENSVLYWASKNNIPIFSPGFVDGAMGDHFFFFNEKQKEKLVIDTAKDLTIFYKLILNSEKTGGVFLGGSLPKHHLIGAAILRNGLDCAVYIQTGTQYDGSLSGAHPKEAVSWNKLKDEKNSVVIEAEATIVFPLLALSWMNN